MSTAQRATIVSGNDRLDMSHPTTPRIWSPDGVGADVVATSDGTGNGQVSDWPGFSTVTSTNADYIVTLPPPAIGTVVGLVNGATGYELRSSSPTTVAINGGAGANAESAIAARQLVVCVCATATAWLCTQTDTDGSATAVEAAA